MNKRPAHIFPLIIISQFAATSLWFAGNAILPDLQRELTTQNSIVGNITSMVQFGFIAGTLLFAVFSIADRFSSARVFFVSSVIAACANIAIIWLAKSTATLFALRFITGFFLAGIYPVGMKIAADWYEKSLGKILGFLVGSLVLGTAFPYLLRSGFYAMPAREVLFCTSAFAGIGGILVLVFVGDGPYRKPPSQFKPGTLIQLFRSADFRAAAFGYFGHMWELYAFWAFLPSMLSVYFAALHYPANQSLWTFIIIAVGSIGCVAGGYIAQKSGSSRLAFYALLCSGICCLASVLVFYLPLLVFIPFMIIWGLAVTADSPQFSTLVAQLSVPEYRGTALTIVTSIGFAITIGSIQLLNFAFNRGANTSIFLLLAPGPLIGLIFLFRLVKKRR